MPKPFFWRFILLICALTAGLGASQSKAAEPAEVTSQYQKTEQFPTLSLAPSGNQLLAWDGRDELTITDGASIEYLAPAVSADTFNAISARWRADLPEGSEISISFRMFESGQWSEWREAEKLEDDKPDGRVDPVTNKEVRKTSVVEYINDAYVYLAGIGGLIAIIMLIYAGIRYMTSYGDPEKISDAKDIVEKALIGLGLLILAAVILQTINPRTTKPCTPGKDPGCGEIDFTKPKGK